MNWLIGFLGGLILIGLGLFTLSLLTGGIENSPVLFFLNYLHDNESFETIFAYIKWFVPIGPIVACAGLWLTVFATTLLAVVVYKGIKL